MLVEGNQKKKKQRPMRVQPLDIDEKAIAGNWRR
jgi:hypothetical protein